MSTEPNDLKKQMGEELEKKETSWLFPFLLKVTRDTIYQKKEKKAELYINDTWTLQLCQWHSYLFL